MKKTLFFFVLIYAILSQVIFATENSIANAKDKELNNPLLNYLTQYYENNDHITGTCHVTIWIEPEEDEDVNQAYPVIPIFVR